MYNLKQEVPHTSLIVMAVLHMFTLSHSKGMMCNPTVFLISIFPDNDVEHVSGACWPSCVIICKCPP